MTLTLILIHKTLTLGVHDCNLDLDIQDFYPGVIDFNLDLDLDIQDFNPGVHEFNLDLYLCLQD